MDSNIDAENLIASLWDQAKLKVELPDDELDFFEQRGPTRGRYESRRSFHRFHLRVQAILQRDGNLLGIYTKDVSRRGVGFLAPVALEANEKLRLLLPNRSNYIIEIVRCNRVSDRCFKCGARFVRGRRSTSA